MSRGEDEEESTAPIAVGGEGAVSGSGLPRTDSTGSSLSVLVTYWNEGELLSRCLASLLPQLGREDEVIVHDDASTVRPESFIPPSANVRVLRSDENVGPAEARNRLLRSAGGRFVHFHDSDDWFEGTWAEAVRERARDGVDLILTEVRSTGLASSEAVVGLSSLAQSGDLLRFSLEGVMLPASVTFRREFLLSLGGFNRKYWQSEDLELGIRAATQKPGFALDLKPRTVIEVRAASRSQRKGEVLRDAIAALQAWAPRVEEAYWPLIARRALGLAVEAAQAGARDVAFEGWRFARDVAGGRIESGGCLGSRARHRTAMVLGPWRFEQMARAYRRALPGAFRRLLNRPDAA